MLKKVIYLYFVAIVFLFNNVEAANWVYVGKDTLDNEYYINTSTVSKTKDSQFKVLYREKLSPLGKQDFQSKWSDDYYDTEYVCYETEWLEFRSRNNNVEVKVLSRSALDVNGNFIMNLRKYDYFLKIKENSMYMAIYRKARSYLN